MTSQHVPARLPDHMALHPLQPAAGATGMARATLHFHMPAAHLQR